MQEPVIKTLRIAITSDLHWGTREQYNQEVAKIAAAMIAAQPHAIAVLGDIGTGETFFTRCLQNFAPFQGPKFFVPGNHDLWRPHEQGAQDSIDLYENFLPQWGEQVGFQMLDRTTAVLVMHNQHRVGLAGSIGWYDYSMAHPAVKLSTAVYASKKLPGVTWQDGLFVDLPMSDPSFTDYLLERLRTQLQGLSQICDQIVVFTHHLIARPQRQGRLAYKHLRAAQVYLGSLRFLPLLREFPKVTHHVCGHLHLAEYRRFGTLHAYIIGSTYASKEFLMLEIQSDLPVSSS